ncbi:MAG: hypothetical protein ACNA8R_01005 [Nitriliruptoraceae bacterium]
MRSTRTGWAAGVVAAVLLTACGGAGLEVEDPVAEAGAQAEPEDVATALDEGDPGPDGAVGQADPDADDAPAPDPQAGPGQPAAATCDLAAEPVTTELDPAAYERAMLDANFELEILVMDLAADLDGYLAGASDEVAYADQLHGLQDAWAEVTGQVRGLAPPTAAEPWHERAITSFDRVCTALADGLAGIEEDDEARAAAHIEAVQGFPSVLNELHANAACGPGESC